MPNTTSIVFKNNGNLHAVLIRILYFILFYLAVLVIIIKDDYLSNDAQINFNDLFDYVIVRKHLIKSNIRKHLTKSDRKFSLCIPTAHSYFPYSFNIFLTKFCNYTPKQHLKLVKRIDQILWHIIPTNCEVEKCLKSTFLVTSHIPRKSCYQAGIYLLKVNNRNTRARCGICSKLTRKIFWYLNKWISESILTKIFIVNFEHISHLVLMFLLLTLNMLLPAG